MAGRQQQADGPSALFSRLNACQQTWLCLEPKRGTQSATVAEGEPDSSGLSYQRRVASRPIKSPGSNADRLPRVALHIVFGGGHRSFTAFVQDSLVSSS